MLAHLPEHLAPHFDMLAGEHLLMPDDCASAASGRASVAAVSAANENRATFDVMVIIFLWL